MIRRCCAWHWLLFYDHSVHKHWQLAQASHQARTNFKLVTRVHLLLSTFYHDHLNNGTWIPNANSFYLKLSKLLVTSVCSFNFKLKGTISSSILTQNASSCWRCLSLNEDKVCRELQHWMRLLAKSHGCLNNGLMLFPYAYFVSHEWIDLILFLFVRCTPKRYFLSSIAQYYILPWLLLLRTDFTSWAMDTFGADLLSPSESFPSTAVFEFTSLWSINSSICSSIGKALIQTDLTGRFWPMRLMRSWVIEYEELITSQIKY